MSLTEMNIKIILVAAMLTNLYMLTISQDAVSKFITSMAKESNYCSCVMKKHLNKERIMTEEDYKNFESSTKFWICDNTFVEGDITVRDHCHVTKKCRGATHRDCNINVRLNYKI